MKPIKPARHIVFFPDICDDVCDRIRQKQNSAEWREWWRGIAVALSAVLVAMALSRLIP